MTWPSSSAALAFGLVILTTFNSARCDVCVHKNSTNGCYTTQDWRQNILCRIDGSSSGNDGYMANTTIRQFDSPLQQNFKRQSAVSTSNDSPIE